MPTPKPVTAAKRALATAPVVKILSGGEYQVVSGIPAPGRYALVPEKDAKYFAATLDSTDGRTRLDPSKRKTAAKRKRAKALTNDQLIDRIRSGIKSLNASRRARR